MVAHTVIFENSDVSIPLWDDWKADWAQQFGAVLMFQFHYGMIGRYPAKKVCVFIKLFQFHYGMIGSKYRRF